MYIDHHEENYTMAKLTKDTATSKNLWAGGWEKVSNGGRNENNCPPCKGHMTLSQAVCEKNIFHLFRFTQPVENNTMFVVLYTLCNN